MTQLENIVSWSKGKRKFNKETISFLNTNLGMITLTWILEAFISWIQERLVDAMRGKLKLGVKCLTSARYFVFFNLQCNLACADSRSHVWRLPGRRAPESGAGGAHCTQQSSVCVQCVLVVNSTGNLAPFPSIPAFLLRRLLASLSESHAAEVVKSWPNAWYHCFSTTPPFLLSRLLSDLFPTSGFPAQVQPSRLLQIVNSWSSS